MSNPGDNDALAFEYVVGTLTSAERAEIQQQLLRDADLARKVAHWQESLSGLNQNLAPVPPKPDTFKKIQARINATPAKHATFSFAAFWQSLSPRKLAASMALMLLLIVGSLQFNHYQQMSRPNADYLAVLLDQAEQPVLTAMTASAGNTLWLKWENWQAPQEGSVQLWAKSRRDGQIRPLLVFEQNQLTEVKLDQATLRLIKDSSHLIMTAEEQGGSAIDEPSDLVLATGVCIRLKEIKGEA